MGQWDNVMFDVSGRGREQLVQTLKLKQLQDGMERPFKGWRFHKEHGMIVYQSVPDEYKHINRFVPPLNTEELVDFFQIWLHKPEAKTVELKEWEGDLDDFDGGRSAGWRVYNEDWGHVADDHWALCAIKPIYLWYSK